MGHGPGFVYTQNLEMIFGRQEMLLLLLINVINALSVLSMRLEE